MTPSLSLPFTEANMRSAADLAQITGESVVYFMQVGKFVKIGFSTNLKARVRTFATSAMDVTILLAMPGTRDDEARLHSLFAHNRIRNEIFHYDGRMDLFISSIIDGRTVEAWTYLEETTLAMRRAKRAEEERRELAARDQRIKDGRAARHQRTKAEEDAYYASLVAERKRTLGW